MVSSEVQRTLVKSPPELWAEISDPESLARHLGEFGEIRITRVHPEQKVEWEADDARGSVVIKPSGWGTKVKLTVMRELPTSDAEPAALDAEPNDVEPEPEHDASAEVAVQPEADATAEPNAETELADSHPLDALLDDAPRDAEIELDEATPVIEPAKVAEWNPEPAPRGGFFARLFGRRRGVRTALREAAETTARASDDDTPAAPDDDAAAMAADALAVEPTRSTSEPAPSPAPAVAPEPEPTPEITAAVEHDAPPATPQDAPSASAAVDDDPAADVAVEPPADIATEILAAEEAAAEQVTAVLTGVLDRLGSAHHRPFSRS